jgi:hypothetical protein
VFTNEIVQHYRVREDYSSLRLHPDLNFRIARQIGIGAAVARGLLPPSVNAKSSTLTDINNNAFRATPFFAITSRPGSIDLSKARQSILVTLTHSRVRASDKTLSSSMSRRSVTRSIDLSRPRVAKSFSYQLTTFNKSLANWRLMTGRVHSMRKQETVICEMIKRLGYAQNNQMRLYGKVFELISDPVSVGEKLFFVDALERKTGLVRRVRIPLNVVYMAKEERHAA